MKNQKPSNKSKKNILLWIVSILACLCGVFCLIVAILCAVEGQTPGLIMGLIFTGISLGAGIPLLVDAIRPKKEEEQEEE